MYTQTDTKWAYDIMTECNEPHRKWKDYIWRWGCLVTCLSNIHSQQMKTDFTPKDINNLIIKHKAYNYLSNPDCTVNTASFLLLDKIAPILNVKIINNLSYKSYEKRENVYWIARIIHKYGGGHYVNVLDKWKIFDVENGRIKELKNTDITKLIGVYYEL